jgi:hypothetical protein
MKTYWGSGGILHAILTSALDEGELGGKKLYEDREKLHKEELHNLYFTKYY